MRALGNTLLLWALGVGFSPTFALVVLCLAAAASILPITAGGAIASIGATSGVLLALGVPTRAAVNFSLASGLLLTSTALVAAIIGVSGSSSSPSGAAVLLPSTPARAFGPLRAHARAARVLARTLDLPGREAPRARPRRPRTELSAPGRR